MTSEAEAGARRENHVSVCPAGGVARWLSPVTVLLLSLA